jgi:hypothetical protein
VGEPTSFLPGVRSVSDRRQKSSSGAKPALPNPAGGGHAVFEKRTATGPRRTAQRFGGGRTVVAASLGLGDMRKLHARPRSGPQGTWGWPLASGSAHKPAERRALEKTTTQLGVCVKARTVRSAVTQSAQPPADSAAGAQVGVVAERLGTRKRAKQLCVLRVEAYSLCASPDGSSGELARH